MFCGVFVEDSKLYSNLHIWHSNAILPFKSRKKSRLLFCFRDTFARISVQMICFNIKLETEWFDIFFQNAVRESIMYKMPK